MTDSSSGGNIAELVAKFASKDTVERQAAREQLAGIGPPAVAALLQGLEHPKEQVRWESAKTLEAIADPAAAPNLVETLADDDTDVRWVAGEALIALRREALLPLLTTLSDGRQKAWLYDGAHHVLSDLAEDADLGTILAPLITALNTLSVAEREVAVPVAAKKALDQLKAP